MAIRGANQLQSHEPIGLKTKALTALIPLAVALAPLAPILTHESVTPLEWLGRGIIAAAWGIISAGFIFHD